MTNARLSQIDLQDSSGRAPPPETEQEQRVAIFDLLEDNNFALPDGPDGPYRLKLDHSDGRLSFRITTETGADASQFTVSLGPLRQVVKDYTQICQSYYEAVRSKAPAEIEALDDARRSIHAVGASDLMDRMAPKATMDEPTARRLFTLVCALTTSG